MRGYWKRPEDTFKTLDPEGWLSTGDQADILPGNYLKIKGRIKEIIVTSTGEKVPPVDIEQAIETDPLFDHGHGLRRQSSLYRRPPRAEQR